MSWGSGRYIGLDSADNGVTTAAVAANADGTVLERLEYIQTAVGTSASGIRTAQSASQAVEEGQFLYFSISIYDADGGAVASTSIDISAITNVLQKSTGGTTFATGTITQPTFTKANGLVSCAYQFLAADWQTGDMYKLVVDGITATVHGSAVAIPTYVWSNLVVETTELLSYVDHLYGVSDGAGAFPASVVDSTILAKILSKVTDGDTSSYSNLTDSLEALSDKMGAFSGDGGANQDDSVKASLDLAQTDLDTIITDTEKVYDVTLGNSPVDGSLASFIATGGTALGTRLPASTSLVDLVDHLYKVDDRPAATTYPVSVADESIIAFMLSKSASPSASSFNNTTDSLEMLSDKLGAFTGDGGIDANDSVKACFDIIKTAIETATGMTITPATLSAANDTVAAGYYAATTLSAVDADLAVGNIKSGVNIFGFTGTYDDSATPITAATVKTGLEGFVNGAKVTGSGTQTPDTSGELAAGYYEHVHLDAVDTDLAAANIKSGVTIFGKLGTYDDSVTPITAGTVKTGLEGFVNGVKVTGSGTQTLTDANDTVAAGYYEATTLSAVDADLATDNIKAGVTIFGVAGKTEVVDTTDAVQPVIAARMRDDDIAFVNGSKITGTGTKTLSAANDTVDAGYYAATTLSAVDADLAVGNIKSGVVIFGFTGTYDDEAVAPIAAGTVLINKVGFVNGSKITGTMPNNAGNVAAKSFHRDGTSIHVIPEEGYVDGSDDAVTITDADFVATNIKSGVDLFGITGTYDDEVGDPITAGTVVASKVGFVNGTKITGTMTNNAGDVAAVSYHRDGTSLHIVPAAGYTDGIDDATTITDADFVTGNIKAGVNLFGIDGKTEVVDTTEVADPIIAARMKTGDVAFVNGSKITGTGSKSLNVLSDTVEAGYYLATTLSTVDTDLATGNIKAGVTIFGISGSSTVKDVSDTTAVAGDVKAGKYFYLADGTRVEGTLP